MTAAYSIDRYIEDLREISRGSSDEDEIFRRVAPLATRLAEDRTWLVEKYYTADPVQGFGVHVLHEEPDHTLAVMAVAWLPGRGTPPHDHGTWAVVAGVEGNERNIRYKRVDDGSRPDFAELQVKHEFVARPGDVVCIKNGGIHLVRNETDSVTVSLHTYGKHVNHTNRSQYDLESNRKQDFIVKIE